MKKIISVIFIGMALLLSGCQNQTVTQTPTNAPTAASAQPSAIPVATTSGSTPSNSGSIRTRMNAPETLSYSFSSNTGNTQINVEAIVEVPEVSSVHLYEVTASEIPAENITAFADHIIGDGAWSGDSSYGAPESTRVGGDFDGVTTESMYISSQAVNDLGHPIYSIDAHAQRQNGVLRGSQVVNYQTLLSPEFGYIALMCHDRHGMDARNCKYGYAEALTLAQDAASILAPELTTVSCGIINDMYMPESAYSDDEAYMFCFTRSVDGIPVTYTMQECNYTDDGENGDPIHYRMLYPYESLRLIVSDEGIVEGRYESPYVLSGPIQTDVELLAFDQVMEIAENILPLTFVWMEDDYQTKVVVDRIVFGYTRLDFKDDMYRYKLVPVWDFFGTYYHYRDGELTVSHTEDYNSLLTINAMDGTVIDRRFGF